MTEEKPKETVETKSKVVPKYQLVEVPTQYGIAIQAPNKEIIDTNQAIVEILNIVSGIKKDLD